MYDAKEIAKFIISECFKRNIMISNLKLQKMLYFLWIEYWKIWKTSLFRAEFYAWQLGPVVPDIYYEYCSYAGRPIVKYYNTSIAGSDEETLIRIMLDYVYLSASKLVDMTHRKGGAWDVVYQDGVGNRNIIPFELIIAKEVS